MSDENQGSISLEDFDYFWMPNGAPCFFANKEDICESIEQLGFQIYYLIGNLETEKTVDGKDAQNKPVKYTVSELSTSLFKVVNNIVGRAVSRSNDPLPEHAFPGIQEEAYYNMPKIPLDLINKLDEFFRLVHAQHGTESIVILTFDPTKNDSSAWGVLVPEQTNTSVHCKYDADSVAALKPDHVIVAGSVHSHPQMSAYASGTDHEDQSDFDGIHITFGWQSSVNNNATQYHAEMQLAGTAYRLNIEDVIDMDFIVKDPDPEVVEWTSKVKKAAPPYSGTGVMGQPQYHQPENKQVFTQPTTGTKEPQNIPFDFDPKDGILIAEVNYVINPICPSCFYVLDNAAPVTGEACPLCDIALAPSSWSLAQIEHSAIVYASERNLDATLAIYLWCKESDNSNFLIEVKPDDLDSRPNTVGQIVPIDSFSKKAYITDEEGYPSLIKDEDSTDSAYYGDDPFVTYNEDFTICCHVKADRAWIECKCSNTIYYEDVYTYDKAVGEINIYSKDSQCENCAYYYSLDCDPYRQMVIDFINTGTIPEEGSQSSCDAWTDFTIAAAMIDSGGYPSYERD